MNSIGLSRYDLHISWSSSHRYVQNIHNMPLEKTHFETLASEFLRALRGDRSQSAFARRLGYKSNIVSSWEAGRAFPTASKAFWAARRVGIDVESAIVSLHRKPPGEGRLDPTTPEGVAQFLNDLRGRTSV